MERQRFVADIACFGVWDQSCGRHCAAIWHECVYCVGDVLSTVLVGVCADNMSCTCVVTFRKGVSESIIIRAISYFGKVSSAVCSRLSCARQNRINLGAINLIGISFSCASYVVLIARQPCVRIHLNNCYSEPYSFQVRNFHRHTLCVREVKSDKGLSVSRNRYTKYRHIETSAWNKLGFAWRTLFSLRSSRTRQENC